MTRTSDFFNEEDESNMEDCDLDCQTCMELVEKANFNANGTIVYRCSKGHVSKIELFKSV